VYSMLSDESRSSGAGDFFVFAGVIVRTELLMELHDELCDLALRFTGKRSEHVKYSPESGSAQQRWCKQEKISWTMSRQAVLDVIGSRPRDRIALVAAIHTDPRSAGSNVSETDIYSWGFDALLQRYGRFLEDGHDADQPPANEVIFDGRIDPALFHGRYQRGWQSGWEFFYNDIPALRDLNARSMLLSSMARFTPPLWLADHLAGAVAFWARLERAVDEAEASGTKPPKGEHLRTARRQIASIRDNFRDPLVGGGILGWPKDLLRREDLSRWLTRLTEA
jgi:hypothetical protein